MGQSQEQIEKIQEILRQMDEHSQAPPSDVRRAPRLNIRMATSVMLLSGAGATPVEIFTRNLSISGIGFVSRRMFRKEERVAISLRIPNLPAKMILARVTFGRYLNNGLYEMGAEFLECISDPRGLAAVPKQWMVTVNLQPKAPTSETPAKAGASAKSKGNSAKGKGAAALVVPAEPAESAQPTAAAAPAESAAATA